MSTNTWKHFVLTGSNDSQINVSTISHPQGSCQQTLILIMKNQCFFCAATKFNSVLLWRRFISGANCQPLLILSPFLGKNWKFIKMMYYFKTTKFYLKKCDLRISNKDKMFPIALLVLEKVLNFLCCITPAHTLTQIYFSVLILILILVLE